MLTCLEEHGIVEKADITRGGANGGIGLLVAVDIMFRSECYGRYRDEALRADSRRRPAAEARDVRARKRRREDVTRTYLKKSLGD